MEEVVDWHKYFQGIARQCPWSYKAYQNDLIDIVEYQGQTWPLGHYHARVYIVNASDQQLESMADEFDQGADAWLFSYPGYGEYATPVKVLIQQDRKTLEDLRSKLDAST